MQVREIREVGFVVVEQVLVLVGGRK